MDEFIKSIKAQLYDRTTSPLSGAFIISWLIWNYKILFVLFSSYDVHEKFDYISTFLYPSISNCITIGFVYPLLTTAFFIFAYPYPSKFVYWFSRNRQKELKLLRQTIEDETPLTLKESRDIRRNALQLEFEFGNELARKDNEISKLKEEIESLSVSAPEESESTSSDNEPVKYTQEIEIQKEHIDILQIIAELGSSKILKKNILTKSEHNPVKAEFYLGELKKAGFVESYYSNISKDTLFSLTHTGRTALVNNNRY